MGVTIAEHVCDYVPKKTVLKFSEYRLQIFLVKGHCLESLTTTGSPSQPGQLDKHVRKLALAILTTYMETRLFKALSHSSV